MLSCLPVYITRSLVTASHKKTSKRRKIGVQLDKNCYTDVQNAKGRYITQHGARVQGALA